METKNNNLHQEILELSDDILADIEMDRLPFDKILYKGLRLARLKNDIDAISWINYELNGYHNNSDNSAEKTKALNKSGRYNVSKDEETGEDKVSYYFKSIPELESEIQTTNQIMDNIKIPSSLEGNLMLLTVNNINDKLSFNRNFITSTVNLINKVKSSFYNYILIINYEVKFQGMTQSLFEELKTKVDKKLSEINPDIIKQFVSVYERISSENEIEWSQAMSTCRNIIKCLADGLFPPQSDKYKCKDHRELDVTDDKYKNRIIAYIDSKLDGDKKILIESRFSDLLTRIQKTHDILSNGTHNNSFDFQDIQMCIVQTYFLLGDIINI